MAAKDKRRRGNVSADTEAVLRRSAGALIVDPRTMRRVIKHDRVIGGFVPHTRCYVVARSMLEDIVSPEELGVARGELPDRVILLSRPSPRELSSRDQSELLTRLWRSVFHARIHEALEARVAAGKLSDAEVRRRIDRIGQTEFDEIRSILRHDDLVMPPGDDREVYIEFAALYLELRNYAPGLLVTTFPGLTAHERVIETLRLDVDPKPLLSAGRPAAVQPSAPTRALKGTSMPSFSAPAAFDSAQPKARPVTEAAHGRLLRRAAVAKAKGNDVRAALIAARATMVDARELEKSAEQDTKAALTSLGKRLNQAIRGEPTDKVRLPDWGALLRMLADRAARERASGYAIEGRLLFELQRAAVAWERPQGVVDLASWALTLGELKPVRTLPATRELRVARYLRAAAHKVRYARVAGADRKLLAKLVGYAAERAEHNVRVALKPRLERTFDEVGLVARSEPERLAREKIVEELLDRIIDGGYLSLDALRDAISRNQLKLDDLSGAHRLWSGDALIRADKALNITLDGIYRRGDVYLRALQKVSSVPFGTRAGRALTLYLLLPLGASFIILEGASHIISPLFGLFGLPALHALNPTSFVICALVVFSLIHSAPFRSFAGQVFDLVAWLLATIFLRLPRAILQRPAVRRWLARPAVRFFIRRILIPAGIASGAYYASPFTAEPWWVSALGAFGIFWLGTLMMGSRVGAWLEDFVVDQLAPTWQVLSRQWLPGLLRFISRFFAALMEMLQRGMFRVDEMLRFSEGQNPVTLFAKGAVALVWGAVAYVVRLYATLLIEPEINPLKHFPVVTVAHKLMLPFLGALSRLLSPLEAVPVVGVAVVWVTVFLLPSVFGFLAWELKENYKLYRATRPDRIPAAPVGPHGETMRALLVAGFHSGTLPKLYERLRRAAHREDEAAVVSFRKVGPEGTLTSDGLGRFRAGIRDVDRGVRRFIERELLALLHRCPRWTFGEVTVEHVDLSSNRVRIRLACHAAGPEALELTFEEQSGFVVAGIPSAGFVETLAARSPVAVRLFENALAGLYQRAEVDLVREQLEAELGERTHYDIADEGLVVWPGVDYETELIYRIDGAQGRAVAAEVRGEEPAEPPRVLDTRRMFFRDQGVSWLAWVAAWSAAGHPQTEVPRLLRGVSLLPASVVIASEAREHASATIPTLVVGADGETPRVTDVVEATRGPSERGGGNTVVMDPTGE
jgi:hypothetical protein